MEMNEADLLKIEDELWKWKDSVPQRLAVQLLAEVYRLHQELNNPWFKYAGTRIGRAALLCRMQEIDNLRKELQELKKNKVI